MLDWTINWKITLSDTRFLECYPSFDTHLLAGATTHSVFLDAWSRSTTHWHNLIHWGSSQEGCFGWTIQPGNKSHPAEAAGPLQRDNERHAVHHTHNASAPCLTWMFTAVGWDRETEGCGVVSCSGEGISVGNTFIHLLNESVQTILSRHCIGYNKWLQGT